MAAQDQTEETHDRTERCADMVPDLDRRLRLIEGQAAGLRQMLTAGRDCEAVLTQLRSVTCALDAVRIRLTAAHLCADSAPAGSEDRLGEIERLLRLAR